MPVNTVGDDADINVLQELNRNYVRAAEMSDVRWYAENLTEDYLATNPDGSVVDRAGFLARMGQPYPGSQPEAVNVRIRIFGDIAIINSGFKDRKLDGQMGAGQYTDVWQRRQGRWLCISAHFMRC